MKKMITPMCTKSLCNFHRDEKFCHVSFKISFIWCLSSWCSVNECKSWLNQQNAKSSLRSYIKFSMCWSYSHDQLINKIKRIITSYCVFYIYYHVYHYEFVCLFSEKKKKLLLTHCLILIMLCSTMSNSSRFDY